MTFEGGGRGLPCGMAGVLLPVTVVLLAGCVGGGERPVGHEGVAVQRPVGAAPTVVPPPELSEHTYTFPIKDPASCDVGYARKEAPFPRTVIWARKDCEFVAPIDGTIHEIGRGDTWNPARNAGASRTGRFVAVRGVDGVRYVGGQLSEIAEGVRGGENVTAGTVLGRVGRSGDARGKRTRLYFGISWPTASEYWWIRRGVVDPRPYLETWLRRNRTLSPRKEVMALRKKLGATHPCRVACDPPPPPPPTPTPEPTAPPTPEPDPWPWPWPGPTNYD